jgi:cell division protein FtsL
MLKLLLCLLSTAVVAAVMLQLRQQKLILSAEVSHLHNQIEQSQSMLWDQQVQVAVYTAPNAIAKTVGDRKLDMVPTAPVAAGKGDWIDPHVDAAAE